MKKRLLSGLLCLALVAALLPAAAAASGEEPSELYRTLAALDIMVGDQNGNLNLSAPVKRAEFTKMAVAASPYADLVGQASVSPYPDVPRSHWAAGYVQVAVNTGLVTGYLDGTFRPDNTIALAEGVTMALRLLGYQNSDFSGAFPSGQMALYRSLGLDAGVSAVSNTQPMTRRDCAQLFYNLLTVNSKTTGKPHIISLGHGLTAAGEVDLVALVNSAMEGPVVATDGWQSKLDANCANYTVYRSGALSSYSAIQANDVIYWSDSMRTLWVHTNRTSGTIAALSPSAAAPTSVTVAGKTYAIETTAAGYALSDLSGTQVGDVVTLLLGRTGVVAVLDSGAASGSVCGVVTAVTRSPHSEGNNSYLADTIALLATDGNAYSYRSDNPHIKVGDLVQVTVAGETVDIKRLADQSGGLSGKVDADGTMLGNLSFADDVQILDTYQQSAVRVNPERLAGVTLGDTQVRYHEKNSKGEITRLILADVTGDMHTYGVLTEVTEVSSGAFIASSGIYQYDAAGVPGVIQGARLFGVRKGPMVIKWNGTQVDSLKNLTQIKLDTAYGTQAQAGNQSYAVSDQVAVYEVRNGDYFLSALDRVNQGGYYLTGWQDKDANQGGCIRVIIAEQKN